MSLRLQQEIKKLYILKIKLNNAKVEKLENNENEIIN